MRLSDDQAKQIGTALEAGSKIEAIKLYREFTGLGLAESKVAVEALIAGLLQREPDKYAKLARSGQSCSVKVGVFALALLGATFVLAKVTGR